MRDVATPNRLVLLGHPVGHSLSPAFQNAALAAAGLAIRYEALDVLPTNVRVTLESFRALRTAGNCTIPHKSALLEQADVRTERAEYVGAANTFWHTADGRLVVDNTDVHGFESACDELGVRRSNTSVTCIGSGGAAAAVCAAVSRWPGSSVALVSRNDSTARNLCGRFANVFRSAHVDPTATLVVNATPLGLRDNAMPCDVGPLGADTQVMDLVYRLRHTAWVRAARARGLRAADGRDMLLYQGAEAFRQWTGVEPNLLIMRQALEGALAG